MRERPFRRSPFAVDIAILSIRSAQLEVLLSRGSDAREKWILPWDQLRAQETLETAAQRIVREAVGTNASWLELVGAFGEGNRHPADAEMSVAYAAVLPAESVQVKNPQLVWHRVADLPAITQKRKIVLDSAVSAVRFRLDRSAIAFRLLPPVFTLGQLQAVYEVLIGKRLHKASFRRSLHAAQVVEGTEEWRGEGRGRPAQLFRYSPPKKRRAGRGIRFEGLTA